MSEERKNGQKGDREIYDGYLSPDDAKDFYAACQKIGMLNPFVTGDVTEDFVERFPSLVKSDVNNP